MTPPRSCSFLLLYILVAAVLTPAAHAGEYEDTVLKANARVQKKDYEGAIKEYQKALALKPGDPKIHLLLGLTYANAGKFDEAIQHTTQSIQIKESFAAYQNLGIIFANQGEYPRAIDAYKRALELEPKSYRAWYQLGLVYATELDFEHAVESYEKSLEAHPMFTEAHLGLGSAHYWSGNREKALEQVALLRQKKEQTKARALEDWIRNTDEKKAKSLSS